MSSIRDSYDTHPLNGRAIRARLARQGRGRPSELDLALDPETFVTDQNHVGGLATVIQLADVLRLTRRSRVCDIGGGLAGSARALAYCFGCQVLSIDVHEARSRDAYELTQLVALGNLVTVECRDATASLPTGRFDVLWGQSAWIHFEDLAGVLRLWSQTLSPGGAAACEDAFLARPAAGSEIETIRELEGIWHCRLSPLSRWEDQFRHAGFALNRFHDLTFLLDLHFDNLLNSGQHPDATERRGWMLAASLIRQGILGYGRWIATLSNEASGGSY